MKIEAWWHIDLAMVLECVSLPGNISRVNIQTLTLLRLEKCVKLVRNVIMSALAPDISVFQNRSDRGA